MAYKVLIVDDEEIVCRGLAQFVKWQEHGFEVAGLAGSVDEALGIMERVPIDVVFMDIRMPGKTGLDMLQVVQKTYPRVKPVILSGFSEFSYAREAIRYGAVDYLSKPVNLEEMEELLERLKADFQKEQREIEVRSNRVEGLMLSVAKGYSEAEQEKYQLPVLDRWYGLALMLENRELSEQEIAERKERLKTEITAMVPEAYVLNSDVYGLFAIIPMREESEAPNFTSMLEQTCGEGREWACGVSKFKRGFCDLRQAYQEAERALRYHRVSERRGLIWYKNIEALFSRSAPEIQDIIRELVGMLSNPDERASATGYLETALENICAQEPTVMQFQTDCIRCLIELNSLLLSVKPGGMDMHAQLNKVLERILLCGGFGDTMACMKDYVEMLAHEFEASDEQQLGKGVIREIQLFIRKHYNESITLNLLADQFYLHPNYLSRLFKEKTGKNFVEYMTEVRMEKVKELLLEPENKVADISAMVGYDNPRYFSKVFKQSTGMTPREYREKYHR